MRVLHVDTGRTMRGGQWQLLLLARGLRAHGVEQRFLVRGELLARLRDEGFQAAEASLWAVLRARPTALTHAHDARAHSWAVLARKRPLIVARRVAFPVKTGLLSRVKYKRADLYIAVSQYVGRCLTDAGVEPSKIRVVYDGGEAVPPTSPTAAGVILAPHFDDPQKGSVILKETGLDVKFSRSIKTDLAQAKVFVYLTREEGLGSAALLAQAAGVPVVASRVGGLPEIVVHEETGLLTGNDPAAVRAAVNRLLADPELSRRLAANARRRFDERFTVDCMVDATLAVYRELAL